MEISPEIVLLAATIFVLRVLNYSIGTLRLVFIARGMRALASGMAFLEALIFAVVMAQVITNLENFINLMAYCLGAAVGSYTGMLLESRFVVSYSTVNVITAERGQDIAAALRESNYGVTVTKGEGRDGEVMIVRSMVVNRDIPSLIKMIRAIHPNAFIEVEAGKPIQRGWLPGGPARRI